MLPTVEYVPLPYGGVPGPTHREAGRKDLRCVPEGELAPPSGGFESAPGARVTGGEGSRARGSLTGMDPYGRGTGEPVPPVPHGCPVFRQRFSPYAVMDWPYPLP